MRDNVRSFMGEKAKREGSGTPREFYLESDEPVHRCDFQWSDGSRVCVPYSSFMKIDFTPKGGIDGHDTICIDVPNLMRMQITGAGVEKLYDLLREDRLSWVREADLNEKHDGQEVFVQRLGHLTFFDWKVDLEAIESHRETLLGERAFPKEPSAE